jgi:superfamily I DNA/RNA helicase
MEVLKYKKHIKEHQTIPISGKGHSKEIKTKAILARTNLGLLLKAIEYVTEKKKIRYIYFEGNINSYTYADEGASLYDVLNLYNNKIHLIKDTLIKAMKNLDELEDYIEKTEDVQLAMMVEIVREYGNKIPDIIKAIKAKHVENDEKEKAEMIFSTVHRCKGMEYDSIQLVNDFITEDKLEKLSLDRKAEAINAVKLNEEVNLLYVAVTRTKNSIHIPETLMPIEFPQSKQIHVLKVVSEAEKEKTETAEIKNPKSKTVKAYSVEEVRTKHEGAYKPWTIELDDELTIMFCEDVTVKDMAKHFGRTRGAITSRIRKLELEALYR